VPSLTYKLLGSLLALRTSIAQMSDRCYLENAVTGSIRNSSPADRPQRCGRREKSCTIGRDCEETPRFYQGATGASTRTSASPKYGADHFGGQDLYLEELTKNIDFAQAINEEAMAPR